MPVVSVNHESIGGPNVKDIRLENFNVSVGGRDLIVDGSVTLSYGRHYGEFAFQRSVYDPLDDAVIDFELGFEMT